MSTEYVINLYVHFHVTACKLCVCLSQKQKKQVETFTNRGIYSLILFYTYTALSILYIHAQ